MRFGNQPHVINQAAHRAAISRMHAAQTAVQRGRIITPPRAALAQVVEELVQAPPTADELRLLTEVASATDTLEVERIEARLEGTRLLELVRLLAKNDVRILTYVTVLLMIYQVYLALHPPQPAPPPPPPAPQVTVNVTVPTDEIVKQIEEQLERARCETPDPSPEDVEYDRQHQGSP